jgi:hypothetical protein
MATPCQEFGVLSSIYAFKAPQDKICHFLYSQSMTKTDNGWATDIDVEPTAIELGILWKSVMQKRQEVGKLVTASTIMKECSDLYMDIQLSADHALINTNAVLDLATCISNDPRLVLMRGQFELITENVKEFAEKKFTRKYQKSTIPEIVKNVLSDGMAACKQLLIEVVLTPKQLKNYEKLKIGEYKDGMLEIKSQDESGKFKTSKISLAQPNIQNDGGLDESKS